jgi:hypothetical protein
VDPAERSVHLAETFCRVGHFSTKSTKVLVAMKQLFPVFLALIPLAAVVSACVTCP